MSDVRHFAKMLRRAPRADVVILLVTFALTVFADLVVAVNIGVILATLHFLRRMASSVGVQQVERDELRRELAASGLAEPPDGVLVYTIEGPLFFAAVENFERALANTHSDPRQLIIRLRHVPFIDVTGLQVLEDVIVRLRERGVRVLLAEANARVHGKLKKAMIADLVGGDGIFETLPQALAACGATPAGAPGPLGGQEPAA